MTRRFVVALAVILVVGGCQPTPTDETTIAAWRGGEAGFAELAKLVRERAELAPETAEDPIEKRFREIAEDEVIRRRIAADAIPSSQEIDARLGSGNADELDPHRAAIALMVRSVIAETPPVSDDEARRWFESHRDELIRPATRRIRYIFKSAGDPVSREQAAAALDALRERALAGEPFAQLATVHSESETRIGGGNLGPIQRGQLPAEIEARVFSMGSGEISEPVPVTGGLAIFLVELATDPSEPTFEDVRLAVKRRLFNLEVEDRLANLVANVPTGPDDIVLGHEELGAALASARPETPILRFGAFTRTAADFRAMISDEVPGAVLPPESSADGIVSSRYDQEVVRAKLAVLALEQGGIEGKEAELLEQTVVQAAQQQLVSNEIARRVDAIVAREERQLRQFYDDNPHVGMSPYRFAMRTIVIPIADADGAAAALQRMHGLRASLASGTITFDEAAQELGTGVVDHGWLTTADLPGLRPKVRLHVVRNEPGFTEPFQLERQLFLIHVHDVELPQARPFDQARDQIRAAYAERYRRRLSDEARHQILDEAGFRFHAENLARQLSPASSRDG